MIRLQLLGSFEFRNARGRLIKLPTHKVDALLAYLIIKRDEPQPRERLAGLFWGEFPEEKARLSLRLALHTLRKALEPRQDQKGKYILLTWAKVQFNLQARCWVDLIQFERLLREADAAQGTQRIRLLEEAIALYRGDLLPGFYDDWCLEARDRLKDLHMKALQELLAYHAERREFERAIFYAKVLLAKYPLQEEIHRQLIYFYVATGDRNAALAQFWECVRILKDELGIEPLPETQALYREIEGWVSLSRPEAEQVQAAMARDLLRRYPELGAPFVGRAEELAQLMASWEAARVGQGRTICIRGEAGAGKTRLVQELAQQVQRAGGRVLVGHCYELEARMPFHPLVEALRTGLEETALAELGQISSAIWLEQLVKLVPELGERFGRLRPRSPLLAPDQERQRLLEGLTQALLTLARQRPLLLFVDDLQWADESSLQFAHYLARRIAKEPLLLVGVYRTGEVDEDHPLLEMLRQLQRDDLVKRIELPPLSADEVRALVRGALKLQPGGLTAALTERIHRGSGGNPFFVVEVLKSLIESGTLYLDAEEHWQVAEEKLAVEIVPETVRAVVQTRLRRVSRRSRELLSLAATAGRAFEIQLLHQATGWPEEELLTSLEELLKSSLLIEEAARYNFNHDLIRRVIYTGLNAERRRGLHLQVGRTLEAAYAQRPESNGIVGEIAKHFYQSGQWARALAYALLAAQRAWGSYAKGEAAGFYQMALELAEKLENDQACLDAYTGLAEVYCYTVEIDEGIQCAHKALELCRQPEKRAEIYCAMATAHQRKRDLEKAWHYCEQALQELGPESRSRAAVRTYYQASSLLNWLFRYDEAIAYCGRSLEVLEKSKDESALALVYSSLAQAHTGKQDYPGAIKYASKATELAEKTGDLYSMINTFFQLALAHFEHGDLDAAIAAWQKSLSAATGMEALRTVAIIYDRLVFSHIRQGQIDIALDYAEKMLGVWTSLDAKPEMVEATAMLACLYEAKGWPDRAKAAFDTVLQGDMARFNFYLSVFWIYAFLGKNEQAIEWLARGRPYLEERHLERIRSAPSYSESFERLRRDPRFKALVCERPM